MGVVSLTAGRPKKPSSVKRAAGTEKKCRANPREPSAAPLKALPKPPRDLSERERAAWVELVAVLEPMRVTTAADLVAFRQMAITLALIEEARETIADHGQTFTVTTQSGDVIRKRPEVEILLSAKKQLSVELSRFGLTPADRARVSVLGDEGEKDALDEFAVGG